MSKKKTGKTKTRKKSVSRKAKKSFDPSLFTDRPPVSTDRDAWYRKLFTGLSIGLLLITIVLALGSGVNGDDEYQNDYSEKLVSYYTTMGADTSALYIPKGNMHYYGGFFDIVTGFANKMLGNDQVFDRSYHNVRHVFNAIFGFLAMFFTALLAKEIAGWRAGLLALLFMFLSPRFLGHSMMNPKDIPFALGYVMALYYMVRLFRHMPAFNWKLALGVTLGMALAIATRAGGLILVGILGLYAGLDFLSKKGFGGLADVKSLGSYAANVIGVSLAGLLIAILFWPFALQSPFSHPFEALGEFSSLGIKIRVLYEGMNIMSDNTSWDYPLQWIGRTIPLFALAGFLGSVALLRGLLKRYQPVPVIMVLFSAVFPVFYVIYKDSILHDGWRHLIFVYPAMIVMAALFFVYLESRLEDNKKGLYALYAVVILMAVEPAIYILRNMDYPYTYFNPLNGGIQGAFGEYETDYWGVSVRQALEEMEDQGIISPDMQDTILIASSFVHNVRSYLGQEYKGKVRVNYERFNSRYDRDWDYGIFPSRYIKGPHLKSGSWPNARSILSVGASGVPLTAVEKGGGPVFEAEKAFKRRDYQTAVALFKQEVQQYPDNEIAWMKLAMSYLNTQNFAEAKKAADSMLEIAPDNTSGIIYRGMASLNAGDIAAAEADFRRVIELEEDYGMAYYYLALIQHSRNDVSGALGNLQKALEVSPRFKPSYELAAQIYEQQGDTQRAAQIRAAASSF